MARTGVPVSVGATLVLAVLAAVLMIAVINPAGHGPHRLSVVAPSAAHLIPGLDVRAAGQKVGEVAKVERGRGGGARIELRVGDDVWPLARGTRARVRFGGTIKYTARYVELDPAAAGPPLPEGGVIAATDVTGPQDYVTSPVEIDDVLRTFGPRTRHNLKATLTAGGAALRPAAPELRRALDRSPPALAQARALMEDLGADRAALRTLVRSSDRVVHAVDGSNPDVRRLLTAAQTTFQAVASRSRNLETTLERLPGTLTAVRRTLPHADRTLTAAGDLARRLSPGVREVRRLARPLAGVLARIVAVGPDARLTLATLRRAVPDLNPFLTDARRVMPSIASIGRQAAKQLRCIRPYSPEIGNFFVDWTGFLGGAEPKDHFARAMAGSFPWANGTPLNSGQLNKILPQVHSVFPRPPGQVAGQPWFLPECGITKDALDPSKDPEALPFNPGSKRFFELEQPPGGSQ